MAVGNWGLGIIFRVSEAQVRTFKDFTRSISSEWAMHSRIGMKDQAEFIRPGIQTVKFTMELDATQGVRPRAMLEKLTQLCERGTIRPLVIGGKRIGKHNWRITDLSEAWETVYSKGELARAKVDVTMQEYL